MCSLTNVEQNFHNAGFKSYYSANIFLFELPRDTLKKV